MRPLLFHIFIVLLGGITHFSTCAQKDYIRRINCGSQSSVVYEGKVFEADVYLPGAVEFDSDSTYTSDYLSLAEPFKTIRFTTGNAMQYRFNVPDGIYVVKLYFAEPYYGLAPNTDPNLRDFSVDWEEDALLSRIELNNLAGGANKIHLVERKITVTDGELIITFNKGQGGEPMVNAIELIGTDAKTSESPEKLLFVYDTAGNQIIRGPEKPVSDAANESDQEIIYHNDEDPKEDKEETMVDAFKESIKIFPNPTQAILTLQWADLPEARLIDIKISDIGNRMVPIDFMRTNTTASFDLGNYPSGMYVITFFLDDGSMVVEKVLKK
ncbi:malectin domain-containing carbohydrate-binding protein [Pareuzebyella sediminis]|uniref:malectin domain-containing carbohydrate-binding protein n=1 Tax=Pareuzebyella sediminis TaxID=2607998 RepID=UPI0011F04672|nr:malectin domain-containing carbohydrate-binding protein [Pareuzebyella sediminis]